MNRKNDIHNKVEQTATANGDIEQTAGDKVTKVTTNTLSLTIFKVFTKVIIWGSVAFILWQFFPEISKRLPKLRPKPEIPSHNQQTLLQL